VAWLVSLDRFWRADQAARIRGEQLIVAFYLQPRVRGNGRRPMLPTLTVAAAPNRKALCLSSSSMADS
jgi:hypothetical protein